MLSSYISGTICSKLEHFWSKVNACPLGRLESVIVFYDSADSKVNKHSLVVVVDQNVVRLDVSVYDLYDLMAVVKSFDHIDEVEAGLVNCYS